jgi:hypothetical protein
MWGRSDYVTLPSPPAREGRGRFCSRPARSCSTRCRTHTGSGIARLLGVPDHLANGLIYTFKLKRTFVSTQARGDRAKLRRRVQP